MPFVILGLGSNLGNRHQHLRRCVQELQPLLCDMQLSCVYESPALLLPDAPTEWNLPFLNMAICGTIEQPPEALLCTLKTLETTLGREMRGKWGPREIDIDIVAYDQEVIETDHLTIPHMGMLERLFVFKPVVEIAPDWRYPLPGPYNGKSLRQLAQELEIDHDTTTVNTGPL